MFTLYPREHFQTSFLKRSYVQDTIHVKISCLSRKLSVDLEPLLLCISNVFRNIAWHGFAMKNLTAVSYRDRKCAHEENCWSKSANSRSGKSLVMTENRKLQVFSMRVRNVPEKDPRA